MVAAVNGHAIAGGCVLACACDYRVMNEGHGRIGVTELLVGVPFPITALEILRFAVRPRTRELAYFGRTCRAAEAVSLGLVDEAVAETQVRGPVLERIAQQRATDCEVHRMWSSPSARQAIEAYVTKTLRAQPPAT